MFGCFKKKKNQPKMVIMHCAATPDDNTPGSRWYELDISEIDEWHKARGWKGCGYHKFIKRNGDIQDGRPLGTRAAACKGMNDEIQVCYAGTHSPTQAQMESMREIKDEIRQEYGISPYQWRGHYNYANKECPGFDDERLHSILTS
jgi:N-acetylmuramoyl-L-alanine amidase